MRIFVHKAGTMQGLVTAISRGYGWHFGGTVAPAKAVALADRFAELYGTAATEDQRGHRRRRGLGNARLFMHPSYVAAELHWWILLTEGDHPARAAEARNIGPVAGGRRRVTFLDQFEAVQLPRKGDAVRWTWRMTGRFRDELQSRFGELIRHRRDDRELAQALLMLHRLPGFHGIRREVIELRHQVEGEWTRLRPAGEACPLPAGFQPFVRRKSYATVPLGVVCERLAAGLPPYSVEMRYGGPAPGTDAEAAA
jgi:hypothetical protein